MIIFYVTSTKLLAVVQGNEEMGTKMGGGAKTSLLANCVAGSG